MTDVLSDAGVLMPLETLALLGSGSQGAAAILNYGIRSEDFDAEFRQLVDRLEASDDIEAPAQLAASRTIAAVAAMADAWLSVRSDNPDCAPALVLVGDGVALAAIIHGVAVECVIGEPDLAQRVIHGALAKSADVGLQITLFSEGVALAGARISNGTVDVAAGTADALERLTIAAGTGLSGLVDALLREPRA